jgi:hypothetical protein
VNAPPAPLSAALNRAYLIGRVSACLCFCALFSLIDGFQALVREDFNHIELPVGGRTMLSGAMPADVTDHTRLVAKIDGVEGLCFTPLTSFKGFWMGGFMWRGVLEAGTVPGTAMLTIRDIVPAKKVDSNATSMVQNPAQIYSVTVWPSEAELRAAQASFLRRLTGLPPFPAAGLCLLAGIGFGAWHALRFHRIQRALAAEGFFLVYGVWKHERGVQAAFSPAGRERDLRAGLPVTLLAPEGGEAGSGILDECGPKKYTVFFAESSVQPRHNSLLRCRPDEGREAEFSDAPGTTPDASGAKGTQERA